MSARHSTSPPMQIVHHKVHDDRKGGYKTFVLAHRNGRLYVAMKKCKLSSSTLQHADPSTWTDVAIGTPPEEVDPAKVYPSYKSSYTRFTKKKGEHRDDFYPKGNDFLSLIGDVGLSESRYRLASQITAREITTCEALRLRPHLNIAKYYGVLTTKTLKYKHRNSPITVSLDKERVRFIVFERYDCSLFELVMRRQTFDIRFCLNGIAAGIQHLHEIGFVHGDIKPANIFVKRGEGKRHHFVIGDFDSTHRIGAVIRLKSGDINWTRPKFAGDKAEEADDWLAFSILKKWVAEEFGKNVEKYDGIGKRVSTQII